MHLRSAQNRKFHLFAPKVDINSQLIDTKNRCNDPQQQFLLNWLNTNEDRDVRLSKQNGDIRSSEAASVSPLRCARPNHPNHTLPHPTLQTHRRDAVSGSGLWISGLFTVSVSASKPKFQASGPTRGKKQPGDVYNRDTNTYINHDQIIY